jgi:4'-phosphopantetheinyl transferase
MNKLHFTKTNFHETLSQAEAKKKQSEYCKSFVSDIVAKELGMNPKGVMFLTDENGKPSIAGDTGLFFNYSHTKSAVAIAISDKPIGVDIEIIKSANMNIALKMFTHNEIQYINEIPDKADMRFYEIWTKKEAYAKYLGTGIFRQRDIMKVDVLGYDFREAVSMTTLFVSYTTGDLPHSEYVLSVCCENGCAFSVV